MEIPDNSPTAKRYELLCDILCNQHTHTTHTHQSLDGLLSLKVMLGDGYQWWIVLGYQLFGGELSLVIGYSGVNCLWLLGIWW